ncbi:hypothetical protein KY347_02815 [Candidatus Woesearchaeota archaeon]|nr:hypothetical protein [Candidatus Woesearchaeota archaeon]
MVTGGAKGAITSEGTDVKTYVGYVIPYELLPLPGKPKCEGLYIPEKRIAIVSEEDEISFIPIEEGSTYERTLEVIIRNNPHLNTEKFTESQLYWMSMLDKSMVHNTTKRKQVEDEHAKLLKIFEQIRYGAK